MTVTVNTLNYQTVVKQLWHLLHLNTQPWLFAAFMNDLVCLLCLSLRKKVLSLAKSVLLAKD